LFSITPARGRLPYPARGLSLSTVSTGVLVGHSLLRLTEARLMTSSLILLISISGSDRWGFFGFFFARGHQRAKAMELIFFSRPQFLTMDETGGWQGRRRA